VFYNDPEVFPGIVGRYADSGEAYESQTCFIEGVACYASEARFGGVVIQLLESTPSAPDAGETGMRSEYWDATPADLFGLDPTRETES
jgi:hypothetical protein